MKIPLPILIIVFSMLFGKDVKAGLFHPDSIYLYSVPYHSDSNSFFLVVNGWFGSACNFQCDTVIEKNDSIQVIVGYSLLPPTIICTRVDTFFVSYHDTGLLNIEIVIGTDPSRDCSGFFRTDTFHLVYYLQPNNVSEINANEFSLSPNPATTTLSATFTNPTQKNTLQILSIEGKPIMQPITAIQKNTEIDVSSLPQGLYFLVLQNERERVVRRFVKE